MRSYCMARSSATLALLLLALCSASTPNGKNSAAYSDKDFYALLGVTRTADKPTIKRAFRKLALKHHPDKHPGDAEAEAKFKSLALAYTVLSDSERRAEYDATMNAFSFEDIFGTTGMEGAFAVFGAAFKEMKKAMRAATGMGAATNATTAGGRYSSNATGESGGGGFANKLRGILDASTPAELLEGAPPFERLHWLHLDARWSHLKPRWSRLGYGLELDERNTVVSLVAHGPAERSGLRVGDVIFEVDGVELGSGMPAAHKTFYAALGATKPNRTEYTLRVAHMRNGTGHDLATPQAEGAKAVDQRGAPILVKVPRGCTDDGPWPCLEDGCPENKWVTCVDMQSAMRAVRRELCSEKDRYTLDDIFDEEAPVEDGSVKLAEACKRTCGRCGTQEGGVPKSERKHVTDLGLKLDTDLKVVGFARHKLAERHRRIRVEDRILALDGVNVSSFSSLAEQLRATPHTAPSFTLLIQPQVIAPLAAKEGLAGVLQRLERHQLRARPPPPPPLKLNLDHMFKMLGSKSASGRGGFGFPGDFGQASGRGFPAGFGQASGRGFPAGFGQASGRRPQPAADSTASRRTKAKENRAGKPADKEAKKVATGGAREDAAVPLSAEDESALPEAFRKKEELRMLLFA